MNWKNYQSPCPYSPEKEGFSSQGQEQEQEKEQSDIQVQIRKVLDDLTVEEICPLYVTIRKNMKKSEMAGPTGAKTDAEGDKRVEDALRIKISGGALPCPLLTYPIAGATDLQWLDFLQKIPVDYGARIVFMAIYAKKFLGSTEVLMKDALSGKGKVPPAEGSLEAKKAEMLEKLEEEGAGVEGFIICSPDVADTRRAEKLKKVEEACELPENLSPAEIKGAVTLLLKQLVAEKTTRLTQKRVNPQINILPYIIAATKSADYLNKTAEEAKQGTLQMTQPVAGLS